MANAVVDVIQAAERWHVVRLVQRAARLAVAYSGDALKPIVENALARAALGYPHEERPYVLKVEGDVSFDSPDEVARLVRHVRDGLSDSVGTIESGGSLRDGKVTLWVQLIAPSASHAVKRLMAALERAADVSTLASAERGVEVARTDVRAAAREVLPVAELTGC